MKSKFILTIIVLTILVAIPQVYAKTSIEIKPNASTVYTNKTISEFFDDTIAMKEGGEALDGDNVDVHMAKNTEWAIVSYFSNSAYGTSGKGENKGITVSLDGKDYLSTNGNVTGVMDFGKTVTYTAGVVSNYEEIEDSEEAEGPDDWGKRLLDNVNNKLYVDIMELSDDYSKAVAARNWYESNVMIEPVAAAPYSIRYGLFAMHGGTAGYLADGYYFTNGEALEDITFRPVIWN